MVVHGLDGLDEISLLGRTSVAEVRGESIERYEISPEDYGLARCSLEDVSGGTPEFNAEVIRGIFEGRDEGPRRDFLLLNNAAALYVGGAAESLEDGLRLARANLESGAALRKLEEVAAASHEV